jgi:cobalt/nickel transport system permease protein
MSDRMLLIGWLAAVVGATFVHDPAWLAALLVAVLLLQGRHALGVFKRALVAILLVNLSVSLAWIAWSVWQDAPWLTLVLRLNLRVLLIAVLTFGMLRRIDVVRAVDGFPALRFVTVLVLGQIRTLSRALADFRDAFVSRSPTRPPLRLRFAGAGRQAAALIEKAERQSDELNQGMRARGFFDDRT